MNFITRIILRSFRLMPLRHFLAVVFICSVVSLYYWKVNPASYTWWDRFNNDIDAVHAVTTVGLLNNSEFTYVYHPAATIAFLHGAGYRLLAAIDAPHQKLLHLDQVDHLEDSHAIIATAVHTSRYFIWITFLIFVLVVYGVLFQLTKSVLLSFLFTFYIASTPFSLIHSIIIRPEILTLIFVLSSVWVFLTFFCPKTSWRQSLLCFVSVGFLIGFAIFSKIQIVPVVLIFLFLMTSHLFYPMVQTDLQKIWSNKRLMILIFLVNIAVFPWWTFLRPQFITEEFLKKLGPHSDLPLVYGQAPATMVWIPLTAFIFTMIPTVFLLKKIKWNQNMRDRLAMLLIWLNGLLLGFGLSIYAVLAPVSTTFKQYLENTQHTVYATFTNILYRGYLSQPVVKEKGFSIFSLEALQRIWHRLDAGNILGIHLGYIVVGVFFVCLGRMLFNDKQNRRMYGLVIILFLTAFLMDMLSLQRDPYYKPIYFIYTITLYGIGLAVAAGLECKRSRVVMAVIVLIMLFHTGSQVRSLATKDFRWSMVPQSPLMEWEGLQTDAKPFWNIVYEALRKHL